MALISVDATIRRELEDYVGPDQNIIRVTEYLHLNRYPIGPNGATAGIDPYRVANKIYLSRKEIATLAARYPVLPPAGPTKQELAASLRAQVTPEMREFVNELLTKADYGKA